MFKFEENTTKEKMKEIDYAFKLVEEIKKKELDRLILLPIFTLLFLDALSSYMGICLYGGIELNKEVIRLAYSLGFLGANTVYMFFYMVLGVIVCWKLLTEKNKYFQMFVMGLFAIYFVSHLKVVIINFSTLLFQSTGIPPLMTHEQPTQQLIQMFDRARFCRWFP